MDRCISATMRVLTDALAQGVLVLDAAGCLVHANPAALRRFRVGTCLAPGVRVRPWLAKTLGLSSSALDRLHAGQTVDATSPAGDGCPGDLRVTQVVLPASDGAPWTALVIEDLRGDGRTLRVAQSDAVVARSHGALWATLVHAVECAHDAALPLAVLTVEIALPAEVGAVCRTLCSPAGSADVVGFLDPSFESDLRTPGSICGVLVSPNCQGPGALQRGRALIDGITSAGWRAKLGTAILHGDVELGGGWHAADRARMLVRRAIQAARPVGRDQRHQRENEAHVEPSRKVA